MADPTPERSTRDICPWCSAALPPGATDCPSCGAQLIAEHDSDLPGLTTIDARAKPLEVKVRSKNRLLSWISGDYADMPSKADALAVAPPDLAVQQEILRLQIAADLADLQAEVASMAADDLVESGVPEDAEPQPAEDGSPISQAAEPERYEADALEDAVPADGVAEEATPDEPGSEAGAAPDDAAERERMRLELEAQIAELQARMEAMVSEAAEPPAEGPTAG